MDRELIGKNHVFLTFVVSISIVLLIFLFELLKTETILVFCDVGQGDGAYLRIANRVDVVIDAGPDGRMVDCLSSFMPFYDHTIELAFLSHPQKDHFGGFIPILRRYRLKTLVLPGLDPGTSGFSELRKILEEKRVRLWFVRAPQIIEVGNDTIALYWPTGEYLDHHPMKIDPNRVSLVLLFQEENFRALFTGDAPPKILEILSKQSVPKVDILKIPHHGSKNGLTGKFLQLADPAIAVISAGKNNPYGHPSKAILDMLKTKGVKIRRTDEEGNIIFRLP